MEYGGPEGAIVFFALQDPEGRLFDLLDAERNVIGTTTIAEFVKQAEVANAAD